MPDRLPSGCNGATRLPPTPHIPVLLPNPFALFLDSEAPICQQSSAFQTLDCAIVHQLAPPDSNLSHTATTLVLKQCFFFQFPLRCLSPCCCESPSFSAHYTWGDNAQLGLRTRSNCVMVCRATGIAWAQLNPSYPTDRRDTFEMAEGKEYRIYFPFWRHFRFKLSQKFWYPHISVTSNKHAPKMQTPKKVIPHF